MSLTFTLAEPRAANDLELFLSRAARIEDGSVRLVATGGVLAVYIAALSPAGLTDEMPTVLGLRVLRIRAGAGFDRVVGIGALRSGVDHALHRREERGAAQGTEGLTITVPQESPSVVWAAISPPRGGWRRLTPVSSTVLESAARSGIAEVAAAVPDGAGELIVRRVRSEVWGRPLTGAEQLPAGAAFAAVSLGFVGQDPAAADEQWESYETGSWTRLSGARGHILARVRSWLPGPSNPIRKPSSESP